MRTCGVILKVALLEQCLCLLCLEHTAECVGAVLDRVNSGNSNGARLSQVFSAACRGIVENPGLKILFAPGDSRLYSGSRACQKFFVFV